MKEREDVKAKMIGRALLEIKIDIGIESRVNRNDRVMRAILGRESERG